MDHSLSSLTAVWVVRNKLLVNFPIHFFAASRDEDCCVPNNSRSFGFERSALSDFWSYFIEELSNWVQLKRSLGVSD